MLKIAVYLSLFAISLFGQITQITTNTKPQGYPDIYETKIVWQDYRNSNADIYLYDFREKKLSQITSNKSYQGKPVIYGNLIAYESMENNQNILYLYDISTKKKTAVTYTITNGYALYKNYLVWAENSAIYIYDTNDKTIKEIIPKTSQNWNENPDIWEDKIVWDTGTAVYLYDMRTKIKQKISNASQGHPKIHNNKIVWQHKVKIGNDMVWNIFLYDIEKQTTYQITKNPYNCKSPDIYNDKIVWHANKNGNLDIFLYDIPTKKITQITYNKADQAFPKIYKNSIVWEDERAGISNTDIYLHRLESDNSSPKTISFSTPYMNTSSSYRTYTKIFNTNSCEVNVRALVFDTKGNFSSKEIDIAWNIKPYASKVIYAKDIANKASSKGINLSTSFGTTFIYYCKNEDIDANKIFTQVVQKSPYGQRVMPVYNNQASIRGKGKLIIPHIYKNSSQKHSDYRAFITLLNKSEKDIKATIKAYSKTAKLYQTSYTLPKKSVKFIKTEDLYPKLKAPYGEVLSLIIEINDNIEDIIPVMVQKTPSGPRVLEVYKRK